LITAGAVYYLLYQRKRTGIVPRHLAGESLDRPCEESKNATIDPRWRAGLVPGE
jgi:hypothetical protein